MVTRRTQLLDGVAGPVFLHEAEHVLPRTMASTMPASIHSAGDQGEIAAAIRIRTSGLLNWLANRLIVVALFMALSTLGPYCFRRSAAWRLESP